MFVTETAVSSNENTLPCRDTLLCLVFLRAQRLMKTLLYPQRHFLIINSQTFAHSAEFDYKQVPMTTVLQGSEQL